ncbi:MAG: HAMP domain-containing histidine kinase [Parabacteroides sp.]|nr:HAMP domain-containing histidine kinase [Parabacteroides sp.]
MEKTGKTIRTWLGRFILVLLGGCAVIGSVSAQSPGNIPSPYVDSLRRELAAASTPAARLPLCRQLLEVTWQQPQEAEILTLLLHTAFQLDSAEVAYRTLGSLCRHYYNRSEGDSLQYWGAYIDSVSTTRNECPDALFDYGYIRCIYHLSIGHYELAMNESLRLLARAERENQPYGQMMTRYAIALVYQAVGRDREALDALREGKPWLDWYNRDPLFELQYLSDKMHSLLRLRELDEAEHTLSLYKQKLQEAEQVFSRRGLPFPVDWQWWYLYSYYTRFYLLKQQPLRARASLEKAKRYAAASADSTMKYLYYEAQTAYWMERKDYFRAAASADSALALETRAEMLKLKIDALRGAGAVGAASAAYKELLAFSDVAWNQALSRQMEQLDSLNNLNDKARQASVLRNRHEQLAVKQHQLVGSVAVCLVLAAVLYGMYRLYRRTNRLRGELLRERQSLLRAERFLLQAKEEAEESNRKKSAFIANISHEIRTPLNAIVGFSELLAESEFTETERQEFASLINYNAELLMNLINDVLDLSRLEAGNYQVAVKEADWVDCCRRALDSVRHRVAPGVELVFACEATSYVSPTDAQRLQQLLSRLLLNAAKFTEWGSIRLALEIDEAHRRVQVSVTDTGCGIPPEKHQAVFETFEKLDDFQQGTGLGLPICRNIALRLGGVLFIDPAYREGARFVFVRPFEITDAL